MKRRALLGHLLEHGCLPVREGGSHSIWSNPQTGRKESIPRHNEIKNTWRVRFAETSPSPFRLATEHKFTFSEYSFVPFYL
jgi:mRNA interferase HicA